MATTLPRITARIDFDTQELLSQAQSKKLGKLPTKKLKYPDIYL